MKQSPTIVLTGGGSGGHITPLLSVARELKRQQPGCQIVYIGHKGDNFDELKSHTSDFDFLAFIKAGKFRRYHGESLWMHLADFKTIGLNVRDFFRVIGSIGASLRLLRKVRPDVVFSKGAFVAVPVGIAARLLGIPIVTHDSDAIPGLANRIIGRWAKIHAAGMPPHHYPYPADTVRYVGIPTSELVKPVSAPIQAKFKSELGLAKGQLALLIAGGGNGSRTVNNLVIAMAPSLLAARPGLHIFHVTGASNSEAVNGEYDAVLESSERSRVKVIGFTPDFYKYSAAADLIIARAGATSIAEFAIQAKACIIIPSPFLAGGHQLKNANELKRDDAAVIINNDIESEELQGVVNELLGDSPRRRELAGSIAKLAVPDSARRLAQIILAVASGREV